MGASVIACCDAPPILEPTKAVFDLVPFFVESLVIAVLDLAVFFGGMQG